MSGDDESRAVMSALVERAGMRGAMSFAEFSEIALYAPGCGYYRRVGRRVGRERGTDFYTASTLGDIFAEAVCEAFGSLLGRAGATKDFTLVEIGAEPGGSIFEKYSDRFAGLKTVRVGDPVDIPEHALVFANELFDAQPFHRLRGHAGEWRETGVAVARDGALSEIELPELSEPMKAFVAEIPPPVCEGYALDVSPASIRLMHELLAPVSRGAAIFFDYGKSRAELLSETPGGTARAYSRHALSGDLLAEPGSRDLTFHVDWDALGDAMGACGFTGVGCERQEAFLLKRAGGVLGRAVETAACDGNISLLGRVRELIHPAHFGGKFSALFGVR